MGVLMAHDHAHSHSLKRAGNKRSLTIALVISLAIMFVEAVGGWYTNSLALMSDAGHVLADAGSLALSLLALHFATRPASAARSFGYRRLEIIAAWLNGIALFVIAIVIIFEAVDRFIAPPVVNSLPMMLIAAFGLLANLFCAWILLRGGDVHDNLNMRSAYLHMVSDALGAAGAIVAGAFMYYASWYLADPIISIIVSLLILKGGWRVVAQSTHILIEGTPAGINTAHLIDDLMAIPGVTAIHDMHVWSLTDDMPLLSCHLVCTSAEHFAILQSATDMLRDKYGIRHCTLQIEPPRFAEECEHCH